MIKEYFTYSKKERNAIIILLLIILISIILPHFFSPKQLNIKPNLALADTIKALQKRTIKPKNNFNKNNSEESNSGFEKTMVITMFYFDPNTLNEEGWIKLGLSSKTIKTILKYVSKGGKFRKPEDIRKIWGLNKEDADRIIPYIRIVEQNNNPYKSNTTTNRNKAESTSDKIYFDINIATAWQLKKVPGIGNSIPYKIVSYREKLGGFLELNQLKEVYDMTDSIFNNIKPFLHIVPIKLKKINVNTATQYDLSSHPYIENDVAKAIIIQRTKYGAYKNVYEVKTRIIFLKEEVFKRFEPYLSVQDE
jgi:competence protein ComEA